VSDVHELSAGEARRVAVRAQLLALPRPDDVLEVVHHLGFVQADPTAAVVPSAELVCWSRLGAAYRLGELEQLQEQGRLVELDGLLRPAEDLALHRAEMAAWADRPEHADAARWLEANDGCRRDVLDKLHDEGPLPASALPDTTVLPWQSSGWSNDRNVRKVLQLMVGRGEVAAAGRDGRDRLWDLAERVYPDVPVVPRADAATRRAGRRLAALGLARQRAAVTPGEPNDVGPVGEPARVEGTRGTWRVDPTYLDARAGALGPRTVLLSPLDRLVFDRRRMAELWAFDYQLEMYKPRAARRFGYWALPVLHGADLVGKVDATAERDRGVLRLDAVHEDPVAGGAWSRTLRDAVDAEVEALAGWLGLGIERS
jgi:uncharacterized protein YcaQ